MIVEENGIRFQVIQGKATAIGFSDSHKGTTVNIPEVISNGYRVIAIGKNAFARTARITSVFLPTSIHRIEHSAFYNCIGLREVHMAKSNTEKQYCQIERYAFAMCGDLEEIDMPALLFMHQQACILCRKLQYITGPIINLGSSAFSECKKIERIFFANDAEIKKGAVEQSSIASVVFIGDAAVSVDVLDTFYNTNTTIYCNKDANVAEAVHYGLNVEFI